MIPNDNPCAARAADLIRYMVAKWDERRTFGHYCDILATPDPRFTLRDRWRMFRTVPRLRKDLIIGLLAQLVAKKRPGNGHTIRYDPNNKYSFFFRSTADVLVWEIVVMAVEEIGLASECAPLDIAAKAAHDVRLVLANRREMPVEGGNLPMVSYFAQKDHLIDPRTPFYRHYISWDAHVPDNDATSIAYGSILALARRGIAGTGGESHDGSEAVRFVRLLEEHVWRRGRYGKGSLCYVNGVSSQRPGVLTWVFDRHNEIDATANMNMLNYLTNVLLCFPEDTTGPAERLFETIRDFLFDLAQRNLLLHPRMQLYYPVGSTFLLWYRFLKTFDELAEEKRWALDPNRHVDSITATLVNHAPQAGSLMEEEYNDFDHLLMAPLIVRTKGQDVATWKETLAKQRSTTGATNDIFEFCHLLYPMLGLCCNSMLAPAAQLLGVQELAHSAPAAGKRRTATSAS